MKPKRAAWLCGCGYGSLSCPIEDIPWECPMCGQEIPHPDDEDDDDDEVED